MSVRASAASGTPAADPGLTAGAPALVRSWLGRRVFPLTATAGLLVVGMVTTTWGSHFAGRTGWALPNDLWGTLVAANRLLHLQLSHLYTRPTGLVSFPGTALILVPLAAVIDATGLGLVAQNATHPDPGAWLVAGPYAVAISGLALLAADSLAERLGVPLARRALLAAAEAVLLWNVTVRWGHPEDAVAVGLALYAVAALAAARTSRASWLFGAAVAVQPLVLLTLPVILAAIEPRRIAGFLARAAAPATLLLAAAAAANWAATIRAVIRQPNWPAIDHPTPWLPLAPHLGHGAVSAGSARELAIALACGCALVLRYRRRIRDRLASQPRVALAELLWWAAIALALRCAFEPVMVAFYLWPALAVALLAASGSWLRLAGASATASALTFVSQASWHGPWLWWASMLAGLAVTTYIAAPVSVRAVAVRGPASGAGASPAEIEG